MVFMNFWYIEHYGACFGDDFEAVMNYFKHIEWLFNVYFPVEAVGVSHDVLRISTASHLMR